MKNEADMPLNRPTSVLPPVWGWFCVNGKRMILLCLIALAIGAVCYGMIDRPLARWAHTLSQPVDQFWQVVTKFGISSWYLVPSFICLILFKFILKDPLKAWQSAVVFCTIGGSGLVGNLLKWIFGRYRPVMLFEENLYGFDFFQHTHQFTSFPSGHSNTAAALVVAASLLIPRGRWVWLSVGLLIAASRIFVGAHYLSDVIAGWIVGLLFSVLICGWLKHPTNQIATDKQE